ncbi:MAG: hypothetical protein JWN04_4477 [Myxococcaceae bacterium]|nr:hypothetical protein [Myxococcaceae bacterium]
MHDRTKQTASKAALVAAMAAGLFTAGLPLATQASDTDKVHCAGINACKGKGACSSAKHACSGKNTCKGKGWVETTAKECADKGGHVEPPAAPK